MATIDLAQVQRDLERQIKKEMQNTANLKKIKKSELEEISDIIIDEIKESVSKGKSPIKGNGRFPKYKNEERYPDRARKQFPAKRRRPVNLFLSGDFLKNLVSKVKAGKNPKILIGFFDTLSKKKEQGHREGANGQPKRPIIPKGSEEFSPIIKRAIFKKMVQVLDKAFKR